MNLQEAKKLDQEVQKILKKNLNISDTVVLGLSGGADSVFLLHQLEAFGCKIIVAHLDHSLRGEKSENDAIFCQRLSKEHQFELLKLDIKKLSKNSKKGLEETGRIKRYQFFQKLAQKYQAKYIITAHHADDNVETVFLNFVRGATLQGLSGIPQIQKLDETTSLFRPILHIPKTQIINYLKFKKIKFHTDHTNKDNTLSRNFLRNKVIPLLKQLNPNLHTTINKNIQSIKEIDDQIRNTALNWVKANKLDKDFKTFPAEKFRQKSPAIQKQILLEIYKLHLGNTRNIENTHLEEVTKLISQNVGNKKKKLGKMTIALNKNRINFIMSAQFPKNKTSWPL